MQPDLQGPDSRPSVLPGTIDRCLAAAAALLVFVIYARTVYPGLFGVGDAAKFSFVGKVLGTPHSPGYPLYVVVSHLFSYLPGGTLAYRMNILSSVLAALAVGLAYLAARSLGSSRLVAFSAAIALGLGRAFWSRALYAKGYTLNAALVCAGVLMLLHWGRTRRTAHLYWAIGIFALSIGNHLVVISLVPALVLYAVWTDAKTALAPRTILVTALLVALGLSQYFFIIVRTWQHAPYLEASASNLSELIDVLTARRYAHQIGAFTWPQIFSTRIPSLANLVKGDMTVPGLLLAGAGFVVLLLRARAREAVLCLMGALGVFALTANMSANEDEGFMLPAFILLWLLAAAGLEWSLGWIRRGASRLRGPAPRVLAAAAALVLAALLPTHQLLANYKVNDHSRRTFETRYFNAVFEILPVKSAIVLDRYPTNMMLLYKLLGEGAAAGRDIVTLPPDTARVEEFRRRGYEIFAFAQGRAELGKFGYQFDPVQLYDVPLPDYLDVVREKWTVALAATPDAAPLLRSNPGGWRRLGSTGEAASSGEGVPYALIGVNAADAPALESAGGADVDLSVPAGSPIGSTGVPAAVSLRVEAARERAVVWVNGVERARTSSGAVLVIVDPAAGVESFVLDARRQLKVPFSQGVLPLFKLADSGACADVGNTGWQDASALAAGGRVALRIDNYRPFLSRAIFYVAAAGPSAPRLTEVSGRGTPAMSAQTFRLALSADRAALARAAAADGLESASLDAQPFVSRIEMAVNDEGDHRAVIVEFGIAPVRAMVRTTVDLNNPRRATLCQMSAAQ